VKCSHWLEVEVENSPDDLILINIVVLQCRQCCSIREASMRSGVDLRLTVMPVVLSANDLIW
jgi:hypothetical protein